MEEYIVPLKQQEKTTSYKVGKVVGSAGTALYGAVKTSIGITEALAGGIGGPALAPATGGGSLGMGSALAVDGVIRAGHGVIIMTASNHNLGKDIKNLFSGEGTVKSVDNMNEFFKDGFGKSIKNNLSKTNLKYDGQTIYKVTSKTGNEYLKKGYGVYLDALHKDHLEVIDKLGNVKYVLNLDGTLNADKTAKAIGRVIKGW